MDKGFQECNSILESGHLSSFDQRILNLDMATSPRAGSQGQDPYEDMLEVLRVTKKGERVHAFRRRYIKLENPLHFMQEEITRGGRDYDARPRIE